MSDERVCKQCSASIEDRGPKAQFCGNKCNQAHWRARHPKRVRKYTYKPRAPRLDAAPLRALIEDRCKTDHEEFHGALDGRMWIMKPEGEVARAWDRMLRSMAEKSGTIDLDTADLLAIKMLGMHPANVYGDDWWNAANQQLEESK